MDTNSYYLERFSLQNGLKVILWQRAGPLHCTTLLVDIGVVFENRENNGISHLLEHLILTQSRQSKAVRNLPLYNLYRRGSTIDGTTSVLHTYFTVEGFIRHFCLDIYLLADIVLNFNFSKQDFASEQVAVLDEKNEVGEESAFSIISDQIIFGAHPAGFLIEGTKKSIDNLTSRKIKNWHKKFYFPQRMTLIVIADITSERLKKILNRSILSKENPSRAGVGIVTPKTALIKFNQIRQIRAGQNSIRIVFPAPTYKNQLDLQLFNLFVLSVLDATTLNCFSLDYFIRKKFGLYSAISSELHVNRYYSYLAINLRAPTQRILKALEKKVLAFARKVSENGISNDLFKTIREKRRFALLQTNSQINATDLSEHIITLIEWGDFDSQYSHATSLSYIDKKEMERVLWEYLSQSPLIIRSFVQK